MKNIYLFLIVIIVAPSINAQQNVNIDPRLVEYLGVENIEQYQNEFPDKLAYYQYFLENLIIVQDMGAKDVSSYQNLDAIIKVNSTAPDLTEQTDFSSINPFDYNFGSFTEQKIYRIGNTNSVLIARPESYLRSQYLKIQEEE